MRNTMKKLTALLFLLMSAVSYAKSSTLYDVDHFRANYHEYRIGDKAPDLLFSAGYNITAWKIRHLPAPSKNTFWSYMEGTYVLVDKHDHKISRAISSDIFYVKMLD
ncbi:nickel/cobalt efflux protein RcnB (plasmid) [Cedecea neteri]|uniref:Nickel/cobalt efflux protein RcnB n=2 Tax=Cedecea neteri TaxID=158822 RepID=A0A291E5K0_9ENTR|nr:nickel/cobalt efflux protein RcnB [Cedecea neteri]